MKFITDIRLLLLGLWLGAAVFFVAVAQVAFAILPQRELAGAVVNRSLSIVNFGGLLIAFLVFVLSLIGAGKHRKILLWLDRGLVLLIALACGVGQFVIGLMLVAVRSQMGGRPIDELAVEDPLRIQFNNLHEYSVWVLMAAMAAALIAFFAIANRRTSVTAKSGTTNDPYNFEKEFKI